MNEFIEQAVSRAEREWRRSHVDPRDLARLSNDLRLDLEAAGEEGVTPEELIGRDVTAFARRLADESGATRIPYAFDQILLTALIGALPGVAVGYAVTHGYLPTALTSAASQPSLVEVLLSYALLAALVVASALTTVWLRLRHDLPSLGRTLRAMALLVPVAGIVVTPVTMAVAAVFNYSNALPAVAVEVGLVAAALAWATVLSRRWALRGWGDTPRPVTPS